MSEPRQDKARLLASIDRYCATLHGLYESFPTNSQEREAIAIAAKALLYSMPRDDFHAFLSSDDLTNEQKTHLHEIGIDTDEPE